MPSLEENAFRTSHNIYEVEEVCDRMLFLSGIALGILGAAVVPQVAVE